MKLATRIARYGAAAIVAVLAITAVAVLLIIPRLTGGAALTVLSGSMTPTFPVGSIVVVRPVEPAQIQSGDAITFAAPSGSFTTHRVIDVKTDATGQLSFTTKGDANGSADVDPVPADAVRGRVWFHVEYLGTLREAVSSPIGLATLIALAALSLAWDRANSFVRRRLALPLRDAEQETPPARTAEAPRLTDAQAAGLASAADGADVATTALGDSKILGSMQLAHVGIDRYPTTRVEQQLMLARLNAGAFARGKVIELLGLVRGHVVSLGAVHMVVSITGTPEHLDGAEELLRPYGLVEACRSAVVHVGGAPAPEADVPRPPESVGTLDTSLKALVLRPPAPPSPIVANALPNGNGRAHRVQ